MKGHMLYDCLHTNCSSRQVPKDIKPLVARGQAEKGMSTGSFGGNENVLGLDSDSI